MERHCLCRDVLLSSLTSPTVSVIRGYWHEKVEGVTVTVVRIEESLAGVAPTSSKDEVPVLHSLFHSSWQVHKLSGNSSR